MAASSAFLSIALCENDVPGAKLVYEVVEKHSNTQLMRWLECRGLVRTGDRSKLMQRVNSCISAGEDQNIPVSVDGGKWYALKLEKQKQNMVAPSQTGVPLLPYSGWGKFPSHGPQMPKHFNKGHIHHHIVESVQFLNADTFGESSNDDGDDIEDLHTAKPIKKGLTFFKSGHVQKLQDSAKAGHYFLKAKVRASYRTDMYDVTVTLSQNSGFVRAASCTCRASAMGRCSHVTGLLYALVDYIETCDSVKVDPQSCTSLPCTRNQGRKSNKQPKKVQESVYASSKKRNVHEIIEFDPRAPVTRSNDENKQSQNFLYCLGKYDQADCMWLSLLEYNYDDYTIDADHISLLQRKRSLLLQNLQVGSDVCSNFPVELVKIQGTPEWFNECRVRMTASSCKDVCSLKSDRAIKNYLNKTLWKTDHVVTPVMQYGIDSEKLARRSYQKLKYQDRVKAIETGFWVSKTDPELASSPDGLILDINEPTRHGILEIKCPKSLENNSISEFDKKLSAQQKKIFCLEFNNDNKIVLKKSHKYFYQVQMQMGVTGLKFCDFVVWSKKETLILKVRFDEEFWLGVKAKLLTFHHSYLSRVTRKPTMSHLRKVSTRITLCSPRRLIPPVTFHLWVI